MVCFGAGFFMRNSRNRFTRGVTGLMLALVALSGMPSTACICADGHVKLFCGRMFRAQSAVTGRTTAAAACQCCASSLDGVGRPDSGKLPVSRVLAGVFAIGDGHRTARHCCTSISRSLFEAAPLTTSSNGGTDESAFVFAGLDYAYDVSDLGGVAVNESTVLPPLDRVIEHRALRI
jgi:hypothetical protein